MASDAFKDLGWHKQEAIIEVATRAFSDKGFSLTSTNDISKAAGISKGSLFKYFSNKERLYMYVLDCAMVKMQRDLQPVVDPAVKNIFDDLLFFADLEFSWCIENLQAYLLIVQAVNKDNNPLYHKIKDKYKWRCGWLFSRLMDAIDPGGSYGHKERLVKGLEWFMTGFNKAFVEACREDEGLDLYDLKHKYIEELTQYMDLLKNGLVNNREGGTYEN